MPSQQKFPELENLVKIATVLDGLKIPYYVTGGFAVSIYGRPRFTADIDIVIKMASGVKKDFAKKIGKIFPKGYVDEDQIDDALNQVSEFNVIDPESGLKIDFFITKENDFEKGVFKRALIQNIDYEIKFISPEDLIISKLLWFKMGQSTRQLEDISSVLTIQKKIDKTYLKKWIIKLDLEKEWQKLNEKNR